VLQKDLNRIRPLPGAPNITTPCRNMEFEGPARAAPFTAIGGKTGQMWPVFDGLQFSSRVAPFALRGEFAIAAEMLAHLLQARVPGGGRRARRRLRARRGGLSDQLLSAPRELRQCLLVGVGVDQPVADGEHHLL